MKLRVDTPTILIVDDMPSNLSVVVDLLEREGYRVVIAQDGEEGLQRAEWVQPDLILLDVMLPGQDGFEICRQLKTREKTRFIPVIFMTALTLIEHKVNGFAAGGVDYVTKPLQVSEVLARVSTHIKLHDAQKRLEEQNAQLHDYQMKLEQRVEERTAELSESNRMLREEVEERKRIQAELVARECEFRTLAENAPDNIVRYDLQCRMTYVNPRLEKTLGKSAAELIGKTPREGKRDYHPAYQAKIEEVIRLGVENEIELTLQDNGLGVRYHHVRFVAERGANGEIVGALAIGRDITAQRQMEMLLVNLSNSTPGQLGAYRRRPDGSSHLAYASPGIRDVFGVDFEDVKDDIAPIFEKIDPDDLALTLRELDISAQTMKPYWHEYRVNHPVKGEIWVEAHATPIREADGSIIWYGYSADITQRHQLQDALARRECEYRTLAENSPDVIVRYDRDCRRVYINPAYEREVGLPLAKVWNKTPEVIWKPMMPSEEYMARLKRVMKTGDADRILLEWHGQDGSLASYDVHAVAEYDEAGQVTGALVIGHNITELKATERRLEESRMQLRALTVKREEAREEERKRIAREIHDELGQILNVLRLNITTLDFLFGDVNPELRDMAQNMVGTVDRGILMVRSLATRLRPAVLSAGIVSALEWLAHEFDESTGIVSHLHVSNKNISLDEDRAMVVFRIVQESLTNVLRHSGATRVTITLSSAAGVCEVQVCDNGKGFDVGEAGRSNSYGIVGMQERALILKGNLDIVVVETGGTLVKLSMPIEKV